MKTYYQLINIKIIKFNKCLFNYYNNNDDDNWSN